MITNTYKLNNKKDIEAVLPKKGMSITPEIVLAIQDMGKDTGIFQDYMEESFIANSTILRDIKTDIKSYINAIKFVTLKHRCESQTEAWKVCFPEKHKRLVDNGKADVVSVHASIYSRTKLVNRIEANSMTALHIQYAGARHEAIVKQLKLMNGEASPTVIPVMVQDKHGNSKVKKDHYGNIVTTIVYHKVSPTVQQLASSKIIDLTMIPVEQEINIKVGMSDEAVSEQKIMINKFNEIAKLQQLALQNGESITDVQVIGNVLSKKE